MVSARLSYCSYCNKKVCRRKNMKWIESSLVSSLDMYGYILFTCGSPVAVRAIIGSLHVIAVAAVTAFKHMIPFIEYDVGTREGKYQDQILGPRSQ